jgi:serine/threonine protein phosphatase PrpC
MRIVCAQESYRAASQDRAEIWRFDGAAVLAIADGAGGRPGGAEAADFVIRAIGAAVSGAQWDSGRFWASLLVEIDEKLSEEDESGETTAIVAAVTANGITGASVGDSEAWLIAAHDVEKLTAQQQRKPFVGTGAAMPVSFSARWNGGTLLLATDGLFRYNSEEAIAAIISAENMERAGQRLIEEAPRNASVLCDDVALVLCRFEPANEAASPRGWLRRMTGR